MADLSPATVKKLYAVRVEYQAYVLAESEADAEDFAKEITDGDERTALSLLNEAMPNV